MGQLFFRRKDSEDEWTQLDMTEMRIDSARPVASSHGFDTGSYEVALSGVEKDKLEELMDGFDSERMVAVGYEPIDRSEYLVRIVIPNRRWRKKFCRRVRWNAYPRRHEYTVRNCEWLNLMDFRDKKDQRRMRLLGMRMSKKWLRKGKGLL